MAIRISAPALGLLVLQACSGVDPDPFAELANEASSGDGVDDGDLPGVDDGDDGVDDGAGDGAGGSEDGADQPAGGIPCDVVDALRDACGDCHGDSPAFGAPMPLATLSDFHVPSASDAARPVHELVAARLVDEINPMPPNGQMDATARQTLLDWVSAGAPEDPTADCGSGPADDGPDSGPEALPCDADFTLQAHAGDQATGFAVPEQGADNLYMCFAFKSPFAEPTQATAWAPIIDDERVVHHWILYRTKTPQLDGAVVPCDVTTQLTTDFVAGWAPGGENMIMPDDVGLELGGPDDYYVLQVHYNNTAHYTDAIDRSGVAFCTAEEARPNTAGVLTFGTIGLAIPPGAQDASFSGSCLRLETLLWPEMHVLGAGPHMHELGRSMKTEIERLGGGIDTLVDVPNFDFNSQGMYTMDDDLVINPGDRVVTTCTYDNPTNQTVFFGEGTDDEMCFNFVLAYPIQNIANRTCGILL